MTLCCVVVSAALLSVSSVAYGHGFVTSPRMRGALKTQRSVEPKVLDEGAPIDYCPHCLNAGGTGAVSSAGPWTPYEPMKGNMRGGFGICGDPVGNEDHMKTGQYANPKSMPFAAKYEAGGVANFEFDATTNHGGFLQFWICDVSKNPNKDIQFSTFSKDCHYLKRVSMQSCEDGKDKGCGPIDGSDPGKWVLPCRKSSGDQGDQIFGGSNGKMAYRIPDVKIDVGVVHAYWSTRNSCTDEFMDKYKYPEAWAGCPGDGGSIGGKPQTTEKCGDASGRFPEEFWSCSDVQVIGGTGGGSKTEKSNDEPKESPKPNPTSKPAAQPEAKSESEPKPSPPPESKSDTQSNKANDTSAQKRGAIVEDGKCYPNWHLCEIAGKRCCKASYVCARYHNSPPMCAPPPTGESGTVRNESDMAKDGEAARCEQST